MEYLCSYCNKAFIPKRTDSLYCSHSCRQFAYVLRKSKGLVKELPLEGITPSEEKVSIISTELDNQNFVEIQHQSKSEELKETANEINKSSVRTEKEIPVKTELQLAVRTDKQDTTSQVTNEKRSKEIEDKYTDYQSRYTMQLNRIHAERDAWPDLSRFFDSNDDSGLWVSERYRCLIDVLLTFTEIKRIELDDLKEVCNAFTDVIKSDYFQFLDPSYPYMDEIKKLRDQLKNTCLKTSREQFKYRVSREQKQNLIVTRFELSQFVGKSKFSELKFREK